MKAPTESPDKPLVLWFSEVTNQDVAVVGGKNASLGEMTQHLTEAGIRVPTGFALTSHAYRIYLAHNGLEEQIAEQYRLLA
jgi:pyruvate,water dikinase